MTQKKDIRNSLSRCVAKRSCVRTRNARKNPKPVKSIVVITTCVTQRRGELTWQAHCWPLCSVFWCVSCNCVVLSELFTLSWSITLDTVHWWNSVSRFDLSKEAVIRVQLLKTGRVPLVPQCDAGTNSDWRSKIRLNSIALIRAAKCGWFALIRDQTQLNRTDTDGKMRLIRIDTGSNWTESHWYGRQMWLTRIDTGSETQKYGPTRAWRDPKWRAISLMSPKNCTNFTVNKHFLKVFFYTTKAIRPRQNLFPIKL